MAKPSLVSNQSAVEAITLHGRTFIFGDWYQYRPEKRPAQFLGLIGSYGKSVRFRHQPSGSTRMRVCTVEEWIDRVGEETAAPGAS